MSLLWEKSTSWRWLVRRTRESKPFFIAFATICGVVPGVIGYGVMQFTNKHNPELEARLRQTARPDSLMMGKVNQERLAEYLGELQRKEDTNDRYVAALRGETLTRKPYVRIQEIPKQSDTKATLEQKADKEVK
ncbi:uncharacterized protein LOC115987150 [Quercus lobata]|uniref:Uncharacterized protein n=1 Tax=Quercus lobata TaxID=97700 RepID=A0A7N2LJI3_QUELO|nr:uncharacterized protein LOC115983956 [Quercus lobata]XP_030966486.1 uncharacterized protein LOC115987150 [Quercus lobata]